MALAKGLTSGYLPLGATMVSQEIADYFEDKTLWAGLTYSSHPVCLAAANACIDVYEEDGLIENAARLQPVMEQELARLTAEHPSVGEWRGIGLFYVIELVRNRETREPLSPFNQPFSEPMVKVNQALKRLGLYTFTRWNLIFCVPPLIINAEQIREGMELISQALTEADHYYDGN
jgi:taurine--2-oxoglutarate transaminase